jgi:orotidine-5'-phosphate decarboxylase
VNSSFQEKLNRAIERSGGMVCVGLDTDLKKLPDHLKGKGITGFIEFNRQIIESVSPFSAAFKLNLAFFEALGEASFRCLKATIEAIPPDCIIIADGKRGDIGNSSQYYAEAIFGKLNFDAATVNPYMGQDSIEPFIRYVDKGAFILTLTSNPGSADFQFFGGEEKLYQVVAHKAKEWNRLNNIGLVVGATQGEHFRSLRKIAPDLPFLIPGVGTQGGDLSAVVEYAIKGFPGKVLINSSRGIIYAGKGEDFAEMAGQSAKQLRDEINLLLT